MNQDPNSIIDQTEQFLNTKTELFTLKISGKIARAFSSVIVQLFFGLVGIIILLLLTLGLSLWLGESMGSSYLGFLIIAGALTCLTFLVFILRYRIIQKPLMDTIVSQLLKENDNA